MKKQHLGGRRGHSTGSPSFSEAAGPCTPFRQLWLGTQATGPAPSVCVQETWRQLFFQSFPLKQTFCIEKIPARLVSFLLLLASAGTICGLKCHALKEEKR